MNPRGRQGSVDYSTVTIDNSISIISADVVHIIDDPPSYLEALKKSKPLNRPHHFNECKCFLSQSDLTKHLDVKLYEKLICPTCHGSIKAKSSSAARHISIDLTQAIPDLESDHQYLHDRKNSINQLDAYHLLLLSTSPPKYHELNLDCSTSSRGNKCNEFNINKR